MHFFFSFGKHKKNQDNVLEYASNVTKRLMHKINFLMHQKLIVFKKVKMMFTGMYIFIVCKFKLFCIEYPDSPVAIQIFIFLVYKNEKSCIFLLPKNYYLCKIKMPIESCSF